MVKPHALYRIWSGDNRLLYVGCSCHPLGRIMAHSRITAWATDIHSVSLEWFDDKASARAAEQTAIEAELPEWNVHGRPNPKHARGRLCREYRRDDRSTWALTE